MTLLLSLCLASSSVTVDPAVLLEALRKHDSSFSNATLRLQITRPFLYFDPEQGNEVLTGVVTCLGDVTAMNFTVQNDREPSYTPPGTRGYKEYDYAVNGSLNLWRPVAIDTLSSPESNKSIVRSELTQVFPEGAIQKVAIIDHHYLFDVGNEDNVYLVDQTMLATGRGFSRHLKAITQLKQLADGSLELTANGTYGAQQPGTWRLILEPQDYLVRSAEFTRPNGTNILRTASSGVMKSGSLSIAKQGSIVYEIAKDRAMTIEVTLGSIDAKGNDELVAAILKKVAEEPARPENVTDFRLSK